jgi:hypothetical protein
MKNYLAIDPGVGGGFAFYDGETKKISLFPMPETLVGIRDLVFSFALDTVVALEEVPKFTGKNRNESTTAVLFQNVGRLEGVVHSRQMPLYRITPVKWQATLGIGKRGDMDYAAWKRKLRNKACELYPQVDNITLKTADALLLLHHFIQGKL